MARGWCAAAALTAVLLATVAPAQDATLTARNGGLALTGDLLGFDGEVYRLRSRYGDLTAEALPMACQTTDPMQGGGPTSVWSCGCARVPIGTG